MLFNTYVKLLGEVIRRADLHCHQYVDDTLLCLRLSSYPREALERRTHGLEEVGGGGLNVSE